MSEQELNRKLAEWAGFREERIYTNWQDNLWVYPSGLPVESGLLGSLPKFTQSLDRCFEWLVPNLDKGIKIYTSTYGYVAEIGLGGYCTEAESPSLALCLAIEELIDSEVGQPGAQAST